MKINNDKDGITIINTDDKNAVEYDTELDLYKIREQMEELNLDRNAPLVSICFLAYNSLERLTKPSIEAILKYTQDIDYELILIDNGSTDETFEYFKRLAVEKKKIYRVTKNIGGIFGFSQIENGFYDGNIRGKYIAFVPNDVLVTKNWLKNMLICVESSPNIGLVAPVMDNCSNLQTINLDYKDFDDMQKKAATYNQSDPRKWQERLRLIPVVALMPRAAAHKAVFYDKAFIYSFADDDMSMSLRRFGYKLMLCGDTFIHHEGSSVVGKNAKKNAEDLRKGREIFKEKYYGVDAWEDVANFEVDMANLLLLNNCKDTRFEKDKLFQVLGVDVRCGTPLLDVKNRLTLDGDKQVQLSAYIQDAKYWLDLKTICRGIVECGPIEQVEQKLSGHKFEYIICGEFIEEYKNPLIRLKQWMSLLEQDGRLTFKLHNFSYKSNWDEIWATMQMKGLFQNGLGSQVKLFAEKNCYQISSFEFRKTRADEENWHTLEQSLQNLQPDELSVIKDRYDFVRGYYVVVLKK